MYVGSTVVIDHLGQGQARQGLRAGHAEPEQGPGFNICIYIYIHI